jgi:tubulin polyglutamylase TTLL11
MESNGLRTRRLWHDIKMIIVKTVLSMVPEIMINYEHYFSDVAGPQCFQIMGFDILVRKDGMPYLLEVNSAPSLTIDHTSSDLEAIPVRSIVDEMIKLPLVRDCLLLVLNQLDESVSTPNSQTEK